MPANAETVPILLTNILPSRWQARKSFETGPLAELARSIRDHGLINAPIVWYNEVKAPELLAGERRMRCLLALGFTEIGRFPSLDEAIAFFAEHGLESLDQDQYIEWTNRLAAVAEKIVCRIVAGDEKELREIALVDNLQRADLQPLEEARALQEMIDVHGYSQRELADRVGKSQTYISQRLVLLKLHPDLVEQMLEGALDATSARDLARLAPEAQVQARQHMTANGLTSRQVHTFVNRILDYAEPAAWQASGPYQRPNMLMAHALAERDDAGRQAIMLNLAAAQHDPQISRPRNEYEYRRALHAAGLAENDYVSCDTVWAKHAAELPRFTHEKGPGLPWAFRYLHVCCKCCTSTRARFVATVARPKPFSARPGSARRAGGVMFCAGMYRKRPSSQERKPSADGPPLPSPWPATPFKPLRVTTVHAPTRAPLPFSPAACPAMATRPPAPPSGRPRPRRTPCGRW